MAKSMALRNETMYGGKSAKAGKEKPKGKASGTYSKKLAKKKK